MMRGSGKPDSTRRGVRRSFGSAALPVGIVAAVLWFLPVRAQDAQPSPGGTPVPAPAGGAAPAPPAAGHPGTTPTGEHGGTAAETPTSDPHAAPGAGAPATEPHAANAPAPAGDHGAAPSTGDAHPAPAAGHTEGGDSHGGTAGHPAGGDAHGGEAHGGGHGGEKHEEAMSIHLPTWISGLLKMVYHAGPASVTADGAVDETGAAVSAAELKDVTASFEYHDPEHHGAAEKVTARIDTVGSSTSAGGANLSEITLGSRTVRLINPRVTYALEQMFPEAIVISLLTAFGILLVGMAMAKNTTRLPGKLQAAGEIIYEKLDDFVKGLIPHNHEKYVPLAATAFLYILIMNLVGLIPGWASPTANINVTAGMAIVVVVFTQIEGIRANGLIGYFKHFVGEPVWLGPLNVPIHVVGELAKILSLSMRLFGNIFGEDVVLVILIGLAGKFTMGLVPFHAPLLLLAIFTSFVQAMVFTILLCVYVALMTTHEEHGDHGHGDGRAQAHEPGHAHAH